jgi:hypothetical protein
VRKVLIVFLICSAAHAQEKLGTIDFPSSGEPEAQAPFLRGLLLLHNFAYPEAERAFIEAETLDPHFAMAYWGQAMTYNHPLWNQFDREAGRRVLEKLVPLKSSVTPRERGYIEAVEALYLAPWAAATNQQDKAKRDAAYESAMERVARANPGDVEAQVFWALAVLGSRAWHKNDPVRSIHAAAILEDLYPAHFDHPGILHYLIHAYDDPIHAPLGLRAARRYAKVASAAPHALHMPSHIFFQLGMWNEAARSNEQAYALSKEWVAREHATSDKRDLHSLSWLEYVYLQQHRYADAKRLLDEITPGEHETHEGPVRETMRMRYAAETGEWSAFDFTEPVGQAWKAIAERRFDQASHSIDAASSKNDYAESELDELRAMLSAARGNLPEALHYAELAVAAESRLDDLVSGPPESLKPANEVYGELLIEAERPKEALEQFRASLQRTPNRAASLSGAARAAHDAGDLTAAKEYEAILRSQTVPGARPHSD